MSDITAKLKSTLRNQSFNLLKNFMTATKVTGYRSYRMMQTGLYSKESRIGTKIHKFADDNKQVFFGYYDVTPFSSDSRLLLALHAPVKNFTPERNAEVNVGYYDLNDEKTTFFEIGRTTTWCWQQGCRLQWYPDGNNTDRGTERYRFGRKTWRQSQIPNV